MDSISSNQQSQPDSSAQNRNENPTNSIIEQRRDELGRATGDAQSSSLQANAHSRVGRLAPSLTASPAHGKTKFNDYAELPSTACPNGGTATDCSEHNETGGSYYYGLASNESNESSASVGEHPPQSTAGSPHSTAEEFRDANEDCRNELISKQTSAEQQINEQRSIDKQNAVFGRPIIDSTDQIGLDDGSDAADRSTQRFASIKQSPNLINQLDELVQHSKNGAPFSKPAALGSFNTTDLNRCRRTYSVSNQENNPTKFDAPPTSYNTFAYLQSSAPLVSSSLPANNQLPIWGKLLNSLYHQKGYQKIKSTDHLDRVKQLNEANQQLNQQLNQANSDRPQANGKDSRSCLQQSDSTDYYSPPSSPANSSIADFLQTVIATQRSMTASSALDLPGDQSKSSFKPPSRSSSGYLSSTGVQLKQSLGLLNGVCIIVGVIVGSGIFISPKGVLETSHSVGLSLSIWICCGLLSLIGALCYAELGTAIPKSGGDYSYIREAFGDLPAFLFLWVATLIIMPTGNAIAALTFANYALVPYYRYAGCGDPPEQAVQLIAIILVCFLTFINCYKVTWSAFLMDAFTFAKVFALTIIIGVGFWQVVRGSTHNFENMFQGSSTSPQQIALSFYSGLFSYAGWNFLNFVTEELKDPFKTLPKAIYISLPLVTVVYVLANVAYFTVLSPTEIVESNAVAITFGDRVLGAFSWTMPVFVVLSTFGGLNGSIFSASRLFFVGARNGHLPRVLGQINIHYNTPVPSLLFLCFSTLVYLSTANVYLLINYTAFNESLFITLSVAGLLWLRYKQPDLERPIKVNIFLPIFFFVVCTFLVLLPVFEKPMETGISALITLTGIPVYLATIAWKNKPALYNKINDSITRFLQVLLITIEEKRS